MKYYILELMSSDTDYKETKIPIVFKEKPKTEDIETIMKAGYDYKERSDAWNFDDFHDAVLDKAKELGLNVIEYDLHQYDMEDS